jgi:hypothetical protein
MPSWDRQPGESEVAYEAFKTFLALEGKRSIRKASKRLTKNHVTLGRWASRYHWLDRARDYDNDREKRILATEIAEEKKRRRQVITQKHKIGPHLENMAIRAIAKLTNRLEEDEDFLLFPNAIIQLLELGFALQETDYPEHVKEESGSKGIFALAESINALAQKTIEQHESKPHYHAKGECP